MAGDTTYDFVLRKLDDSASRGQNKLACQVCSLRNSHAKHEAQDVLGLKDLIRRSCEAVYTVVSQPISDAAASTISEGDLILLGRTLGDIQTLVSEQSRSRGRRFLARLRDYHKKERYNEVLCDFIVRNSPSIKHLPTREIRSDAHGKVALHGPDPHYQSDDVCKEITHVPDSPHAPTPEPVEGPESVIANSNDDCGNITHASHTRSSFDGDSSRCSTPETVVHEDPTNGTVSSGDIVYGGITRSPGSSSVGGSSRCSSPDISAIQLGGSPQNGTVVTNDAACMETAQSADSSSDVNFSRCSTPETLVQVEDGPNNQAVDSKVLRKGSTDLTKTLPIELPASDAESRNQRDDTAVQCGIVDIDPPRSQPVDPPPSPASDVIPQLKKGGATDATVTLKSFHKLVSSACPQGTSLPFVGISPGHVDTEGLQSPLSRDAEILCPSSESFQKPPLLYVSRPSSETNDGHWTDDSLIPVDYPEHTPKREDEDAKRVPASGSAACVASSWSSPFTSVPNSDSATDNATITIETLKQAHSTQTSSQTTTNNMHCETRRVADRISPPQQTLRVVITASGVESDEEHSCSESERDAEKAVVPSEMPTVFKSADDIRNAMTDKQLFVKMLTSALPHEQSKLIANLLQNEIRTTECCKTRKKCTKFLQCLFEGHQVLPDSLILNEIELVGCTLGRPIGGGGFSDIYKGNHRGKVVCLKLLRTFTFEDQNQTRSNIDKLCGEALLWTQLDHPNVLPFYGVNTELFGRLSFCLVSPWMSNGSVTQYLASNPGHDKLRVIREVAEGIAYLHSRQIIHGDIKPANILVDEDGCCRLADFGLAKAVAETSSLIRTPTSHTQGGTARYMAPELLLPTGVKADFPGDVYAYG
ncbi:hypothetical protein V5O48_004164, partial [Marasmius crinis-equi]